MIYKFPYHGEWLVTSDSELDDMKRCGDVSKKLNAREIKAAWKEYMQNPLAHYLPHGLPWRGEQKAYADGKVVIPAAKYPKEFQNDGVAFMNDWESDYVMFKAPRKVGKSYAGAAKMAALSIETDPSWPCYSGEGGWLLKPIEWDGPTTIVVASFSWTNLQELWEVYREVWPRDELGPYAPNWGMFDGEEGKARNITVGDGRPKVFKPQKSGGRVVLLCYSQPAAVWNNFKARAVHSDEQIPLHLLNAAEDGQRTMGDYTPVIFTWSGFKLPERPDTGAGGPMAQIWSGRLKRGSKKVGRYNMDVPSTPDAIVSPKKKKDLYDLYANPEIERDIETERRGLACYYPGDEPGGGLMFGPDVWDKKHHIIPALWDDDNTPRDPTKYRSCDYGGKSPVACGWYAVAPLRVLVKDWPRRGELAGYPHMDDVFMVMYRLLYKKMPHIAEAAKTIIEMSHNTQRMVDRLRDDEQGFTYDVFEEQVGGEQFYLSVLDSRSGSRPTSVGVSRFELFYRFGLSFDPAKGSHNVRDDGTGHIQMLKELLRLDWNKPHPFMKDSDGEFVKGCPKLFLFDAMCDPFVNEIEALPEEMRPSLKSRFPDHAIDQAKYFASCDPTYMGDEMIEDEIDEEWGVDGGATPYTGW